MALDDLARNHYTRQATLTRDATEAVMRLWDLGPAQFEAQLQQAAGVFAAGQLAAAQMGADYVTQAAAAQGVTASGRQAVARAFAGQTADGIPLTDVLRAPLTRFSALREAGATDAEARMAAGSTLSRLVSNEVTQSGTNATTVAMIGQPGISGYVRMLSRPSCGRCAVLAGKWFEWNQGFARHPGCDCVHVPAAEERRVEGLSADPKAYFRSLSQADQDHYFGKSEAAAIRDGADLTRTVNATTVKSGMRSGAISTKPTGGVANVLRATERLPRDKVVDRLMTNGYLDDVAPLKPTAPAAPRTTGSSDYQPGQWRELTADEIAAEAEKLPAHIQSRADKIAALRQQLAAGRPKKPKTVKHKFRNGDRTVTSEVALTKAQRQSVLDAFDDSLRGLPERIRDEAVDLFIPSGDPTFAGRNAAGGYVVRGTRRIQLAPALAKGRQWPSGSGWHAPYSGTVDTLRGTISHEMGHVVDNILDSTYERHGPKPSESTFWTAQFDGVVGKSRRHKADAWQYARTNPAEGYAEAFAQWVIGGPGSSPIADAYARRYRW